MGPSAPGRSLTRTPRAGPSTGSKSTPPPRHDPGWQPAAPALLGAGLPRRGPAPRPQRAGKEVDRAECAGGGDSGARGAPGGPRGRSALPCWLPAGTRPSRCPGRALALGPLPPPGVRGPQKPVPLGGGAACSVPPCLQVQTRVGGCE